MASKKLVLVYTGGGSRCGFMVPEDKIAPVLVGFLVVLVPQLRFGEEMGEMYAFSTDYKSAFETKPVSWIKQISARKRHFQSCHLVGFYISGIAFNGSTYITAFL